MKKRMIQLICLVLVVCSVIGLTACGGKSSAKNVLKWEVLRAGYGNIPYEKLADAFMKEHPDIQVKIIFNPDIRTTTAAKLESNNNNISDVYSVDNIDNIKRWAINGWVEPIDDIFDTKLSTGKTIRESLTGNAADCCSYQGKAYAIPEYQNVTGFVYNKTLFDQNNWKIPKTTAELETLCKAIQKKGIAPIVYCGASAGGYLYFGAENWTYQYEGIANLDKFYTFSSAEVFNPAVYKGKEYALKNMQKFLFGKYTMLNSEGMTHINAQTELIKGNAAMMMNGSWFENEMSKVLAENPNVELGMFPIPEDSDSSGKVRHSDTYTTVDNKRVIQASYGSFYFIPTKAANKETAKMFMKFLSEPSSCELYTQHTNAIRPLDYEVSPDAAVYKDMSFFGKCILQMAHDNYLYAPYTTSSIALKGLTGFWARGNNPYIDIRDGVETVKQALQKDYDFAKASWNQWKKETD